MADEMLLGEVANVIMGQSPPGSTYNEVGKGLPFFQGVKDFGYRHPSVRVFCSQPSRIAQPGDILFSVRAPIGRVNIADRECAIGRGISIIRANSSEDSRYIEFVLRLLEPSWDTIEGSGSVFGNATRRDLESLPVPWPGNAIERQAIACILGALDDKIELNRRMNETLEGIAQAIFKSWFVDFDPVRAKAAGQQPPGLAPYIADLFPDEFVESELGEIPKGWRVAQIGDVCEFAYGKGLKESKRQPGDVPVYGSNGQVGWHNEALVKGPGIVVGRKGNPGVVTWVQKDFFPIDTTFYVVPKDRTSMYWLYYALSLQDLPSLGADSAVPGLNRNIAYMSKWLIPTSEVISAFDDRAKPVFDKISENDNESRILAALRDTLLPKLISGELRVPDAERIVERCV